MSKKLLINFSALCVSVAFIFTSLFAENHMNLMKELVGEHPESEYGFSVKSLDFNGDGIDDLVVGSYGWDPNYSGGPNTAKWGKIYFYFGKEENFADSADITISGYSLADTGFVSLGKHLENLGDMNNDGFDDLGFYNKTKDDTGSVYMQMGILLGGNPCDTIPDYMFTFSLSLYDDTIGAYIRRLGDINGDGYDDAAVILGPKDTGYPYPHAVYLIYGDEFDITYFGTFGIHTGTYGSANVRGIGDVNNDGFDDFIIGYGVNEDYTFYNLLYFGDTVIDSIPDIVINDYIEIPYLNTAGGIACGDWNGDGFDDFIGNCCSDVSQGLGIWYGGDTLELHPQIFVEYYSSLRDFDKYDYGDLNNDGKNDMVIGLHWYAMYDGRAYIYLGGENGSCDLLMEAPYIAGRFGWAVAVGDYNNDGCADAAIGAFGENWAPSSPNNDKGMVFVYAGNDSLVDINQGVDDEEFIINNENLMRVFPNPVNQEIKFEVNRTAIRTFNKTVKDIKIKIFNIKGQQIITLPVESDIILFQTKKLGSGVYFCKLVQGNHLLITKKVTLIK